MLTPQIRNIPGDRSTAKISARHAALGLLDEVDQMRDLRRVRGVVRLERADGSRHVAVLFQEQLFISGFQVLDVFIGESAALQAHQVQPADVRRISIHDHERRHVLHHLRATADDRVFPDPAELMRRGEAGNDGVVLDDDVAGEAHGIGQNDVVAELAIVRDVRVAEKQVMRADPRRHIAVRAAVDGGVFPENIQIADLQVSRIADVFQILRLSADRGEGEKFVRAADFRVPIDHDMGVQNAVIAELDVGTDDAIRADSNVFPDRGQR